MPRTIYEGPQTGVYLDDDKFARFIEITFSDTEIITSVPKEIAIMLPAYLTVVHYHKYYSHHNGKDLAEVKLFGNREAFGEIEKIILKEVSKSGSKGK